MIHLATGILVQERRLLMVASRYPNHPAPLWTLPGGRQLPGELLAETVAREVLEETGVRAEAREVAYVSESYDRDEHYLNVTFVLEASFDSVRSARCAPDDTFDSARYAEDDTRDHVVAVEWVPMEDVGERMTVAVVREPLIAYLRGELTQRYAGFHEAGVTIQWPADSR
ncbi:MAG: NUDIX domain-containing protein [Candidatus Cybelea sp.]